jgi:L-fuconate dehydratase
MVEDSLDPTVTGFVAEDIRFPTSRDLDGSDAMNPAPDYSAAYVVLETNHPDGLEGHGLTFTIGRGNDLAVHAVEILSESVVGRRLSSITSSWGEFWRELAGESQLRWLGPEKGVVHLATAAVVNALWDLQAKAVGKPLWRLLVDMPSEEIVSAIDFRYISDVLPPGEAFEMLQTMEAGREERINSLVGKGYPAYTTSVGWMGYEEEKVGKLCRDALAAGFREFKVKVGGEPETDRRRVESVRREIGDDAVLMLDANQVWDVDEAIERMKPLAVYRPLWIEEPTSPDDVLGHARIQEAIAPVGVATGEHVHNRIMFKQLFQANALSYCQLDACRLGGVNEVLAVLLMAKKFDVPVCPHAGGVGLCEYVQHVSMFDFVRVSGTMNDRRIEFVDHLHEHFVDPVVVVDGRYRAPERAGFSIEMKDESRRKFRHGIDRT